MEVKTMELKKVQHVKAELPKNISNESTYESSSPSKKAEFQNFIADVKAELKKITWTEYSELVSYTKIVVGTTFFFGMGVYMLDLLIQTSLGLLEFGIRLIGG